VGGAARVLDFSGARFLRGNALPVGALTPTSALPPARCGYRRYHIDTIRSGAGVGTTDGMDFSPDGSKLVLPLAANGEYQLHLLNADGTNPVCITCTPGSGQNDGARWRPGSADTLVFISDRDHPYAIGGAGGGAGQELYAMKIDGSKLSRLTVSGAWATNYHVNWSRDGKKLVWGRTQGRTWDVVVADFVEDAAGFRLANLKTLPRDTTWWEPHGFSADGGRVIASHSRAGLLSSDIYAVRISDGQTTRLTGDLSWDEHAHLSPDGRKLAWMSGRSRPASVQRLNDGSLSPIFDFFWIGPGVFFQFVNPPAGYAAELYIMDADGRNVQQLTSDGEVVADSMWSPDGKRIVFRQSEPRLFGGARVRVLTFDDCQP
jgi:TolB protein